VRVSHANEERLMSGPRFDLWTRRHFGRVAAGCVAALAGSTTLQTGGAKKKRRKRKQKSPPKQTCRALLEECGFTPEERCCGALVCNDNTCAGDPVCVRPEGGSCRDICDCQFGLQCSDRFANTCRQCTLLQNPCNSPDDCCLATAACGSTIFATGVCCQQLGNPCGLDSDCCANTGRCAVNGCGGIEPVCCRGQGSPCGSHCECCNPLRCTSGACQ
jgi:hypothetical protein